MNAVQTKERPILFSGHLVRAILEGKKTQTRRPVNPQPVVKTEAQLEPGDVVWFGGELCRLKASRGRNMRAAGLLNAHPVACPFGAPGDRLWVRETWQLAAMSEAVRRTKAGQSRSGTLKHRADGARRRVRVPLGELVRPTPLRWKPSIHMPRWACRLTLRVTDVRVERLQEITCSDIRAEGRDCPTHDFPGGFCTSECPDLREAWAVGWDSIYAKRGFGWDATPWVWVVSFEREVEDAT